MRKYFENITGVATGSDMVMKHSPNVALQYCGFKAEGITDNSVWIKKTHFPMSLPFQSNWKGEVALICSRYQLDVDPSFFYLTFTQTHGKQFENNLVEEEPVKTTWLDFQKRSTDAYNHWFNYWIKMAETTERPIYFFRFEDVMENPRLEI